MFHVWLRARDCDGLDGGLDQPGEPIIYDGKNCSILF